MIGGEGGGGFGGNGGTGSGRYSAIEAGGDGGTGPGDSPVTGFDGDHATGSGDDPVTESGRPGVTDPRDDPALSRTHTINRTLLLYPPAYRTAHGPEIADVHRELTSGLPRLARLRADADLAGHALRVRLGLDSASPGGRFFALAAPFALAVVAVGNGLVLTRWYAGLVGSPAPAWTQLAHMDVVWGLHYLFALLVCVGAVVALCGRWVPGVAVAACGLLGHAVQAVAAPQVAESAPVVAVAGLLAVGVVAACPADLRPDRRLSAVAGAVAGVGWFPVVAVGTGAFGVSTDYDAWPVLVLAAAGVALAVRRRSSGVREIGAMGVASVPVVAGAGVWGPADPLPFLGLLLVLPVAEALAAGVRALRRRR